MYTSGEIASRLVKIREARCGARGQRAFAALLGVGYTTYRNYEEGRLPPPEVIYKAAEVSGRSATWILTGEEPAAPRPAPFPLPAGVTLGVPDHPIARVPASKFVVGDVPVIAEVACGDFDEALILTAEHELRRVGVSGRLYGRDGSNRFGIVARGDSMVPTILPGDVLVFEGRPGTPFDLAKVKDRAIVCTSFEGRSTVKRLFRGRGGRRLILRPDNVEHWLWTYDTKTGHMYRFGEDDDEGQLRIDGVLLGLVREKF